MATPTLPAAARVHVALARVLDWFWPAAAARAYADALARAPRSAELQFLRGQALGRAEYWPEAVRCLTLAAHLDPSSAEYQGALVLALGHAGRDEALLEALQRFAQLRPGEGEAHVLIGALQRRCGRTAEALRSFRLAVRLSATPSTKRFLLGEMLLGRDGWEGALAACGWARELKQTGGAAPATGTGRSALNYHPGRPVVAAPRVRRRRRFALPKGLPPRARALPAILREAWAAVRERGAMVLDRQQRLRAIRRAWRETRRGGPRGRAA